MMSPLAPISIALPDTMTARKQRVTGPKILPQSKCRAVLFFFFFFFCFLGPHLWNTAVPRLRVEMELQLPAHTPATAMQDPSQDLHHSSRQD